MWSVKGVSLCELMLTDVFEQKSDLIGRYSFNTKTHLMQDGFVMIRVLMYYGMLYDCNSTVSDDEIPPNSLVETDLTHPTPCTYHDVVVPVNVIGTVVP